MSEQGLPRVPDPRRAKARQYLALAGLALLAVLVIVWLFTPSGSSRPRQARTEDETLVRKIQPPAPVDPQQAWVAKGERQIEELRKERTDLMREFASMRKEMESLRTQLEAVKNRPVDAPKALATAGSPPASPSPARPEPARKPVEKNPSSGSLLPPLPERPEPPEPVASNEPAVLPRSPADLLPPISRAGRASSGRSERGGTLPEEEILELEIGHPAAKTQDGEPPRTVDDYIPAGSFGRVLLLSGLDAPTGGAAQRNPVPFIVRLKDHGRLPNGFRSRLKECVVVLAGRGDISSERVYARAERLSCVLEDGRVIETQIDGYLAGEDGKAGMRGRLVSKQGALIARSLLAGVAGGIGSGISESYTSLSTNALGTVQTVDPDKILEQGVAEGVGTALDRISQWYLERADEAYPVIEVDAGRYGELVLVKGVFVSWETVRQASIDRAPDAPPDPPRPKYPWSR